KLIAGNAGPRPRGSANLGREVGKRHDIVAHADAGVAKLPADGLDAVAGIAREVDHDIAGLIDLFSRGLYRQTCIARSHESLLHLPRHRGTPAPRRGRSLCFGPQERKW